MVCAKKARGRRRVGPPRFRQHSKEKTSTTGLGHEIRAWLGGVRCGPPERALMQCAFDYATRGHFIVAFFEITFRSSFGVCHRNTTVLAPGCGLATCTDSKPTRCKQKVPRPTETVFANSAIKQTTKKKKALQLH